MSRQENAFSQLSPEGCGEGSGVTTTEEGPPAGGGGLGVAVDSSTASTLPQQGGGGAPGRTRCPDLSSTHQCQVGLPSRKPVGQGAQAVCSTDVSLPGPGKGRARLRTASVTGDELGFP